MQIDRLKTFAAAADLRSFSRAADACSLTQPAVSQQIRELEAFFGVTLFERSGHQMLPTPAALILRLHVGRILAELDAGIEAVRELSGSPGGTISVGASEAIGMYLLPKLVGAFRQIAPHVKVAMRISSQDELTDALTWKDIDLALLECDVHPKHRKEVEAVEFAADEIVFFVSPRHPFAGKKQIRPSDLLGVPILTRPEGSPTRALIFRHLAEAGLDTDALDNPIQLANTEALKQAVEADLGVGFTSRFTLTREIGLGLLVSVPIKDVAIRQSLWMASLVGAKAPDRLERFKEFLLTTQLFNNTGSQGPSMDANP